MSDVREVTEWHDAMEGTLTVAGERLHDAIMDMIISSRIPAFTTRFVTGVTDVIDRKGRTDG